MHRRGIGRTPVTPVLVTISCLTVLGIAAIVGLEMANRPVSAIVYLMSAVIVPTIPAMFAFAGTSRTNHTLENGFKDEIAAVIRRDAEERARAVLEELSLRATPRPGGPQFR